MNDKLGQADQIVTCLPDVVHGKYFYLCGYLAVPIEVVC